MKHPFLWLLCLVFVSSARAESLTPSQLDPAFSVQREAAFIPWSTPQDGYDYWKKISPTHVPIYHELKGEGMNRDIYTPNPGVGYWVLGGLTEKALFKTHEERVRRGEVLVSASIFTDEGGKPSYWAVWASEPKASALFARMKELGITPATIQYDWMDRLKSFSISLTPFFGILCLSALLMASLSLIVSVAALIWVRRSSGN